MARNLAEVELIATSPETPTFENTIAAFERYRSRVEPRGHRVQRLQLDDERRRRAGRRARDGAEARGVQRPGLPERAALQAHRGRLRARETSGLTPEQQRLAWYYYTNFVRAGAKLDAPAKQRLAEINQQLAALYTTFSQNVLADENDQMVLIDKEADLDGLPESVREGAALAAEARGKKGQWAVVEHALERRPVPDLLQPARPARKGLAHVRQPRRQRRGHRQQRDDHADPETAQGARHAARLREPRPLAARERDGKEPGARAGADDGGLAAGRCAGARGSGRHAGARRQGRRRHHDRALGLPLLRRESPQGEIRPRREPRSRPTCSSRTCAKACSTWRRSCSGSTSGP